MPYLLKELEDCHSFLLQSDFLFPQKSWNQHPEKNLMTMRFVNKSFDSTLFPSGHFSTPECGWARERRENSWTTCGSLAKSLVKDKAQPNF